MPTTGSLASRRGWRSSSRDGHWLDLGSSPGGIVVAGWLAWSLGAFARRSWATGRISATSDETPPVIPHRAMAFGAVLLTLPLVARAIRLPGGEPPEEEVNDGGRLAKEGGMRAPMRNPRDREDILAAPPARHAED